MADIDPEQLAELLSAYLDGETDARETDTVERVLRDDTAARQLLEELRRTSDLVSTLPRHTAPPSVAEDLRARAERTELLGDFEEVQARSTGGRSLLAGLFSLAAVLTLIVVGVSWYTGRATAPGPDDNLVATAAKDHDAGELPEPVRREERAVKKSSKGPSATRRDRGSRDTTATPREKGPERKKQGPTRLKKPSAGIPAKGERVEPPPSTPAIAIPQMTEAVFLAKAGVEQKLASGMDVTAVREHPFANEPVRLQIVLNNTAQREAASLLLANSLTRQHLVDLSTREDKTTMTEDEPQAFFYRGKQGVNFNETDQRQFLVRVPAKDLSGFFDGIARIPGAGERVALVSGPAVVRGLRNARQALLPTPESARLGQPVEVGAGSRGKGPADVRNGGEAEELGIYRGGLYNEIRRIVNGAPTKEETVTADANRHRVHRPEPMAPEAEVDLGGQAAAEPVEVATETAPGGGVARARGEVVASREVVDESTIAEPPSLVNRRLKALDKSRRAGGSRAKSERPREVGPTFAEASRPSEPRAPASWIHEQPAEGYVTLVVQLMAPMPEAEEPPGRPGEPKSKGPPAAKAKKIPAATPVNR